MFDFMGSLRARFSASGEIQFLKRNNPRNAGDSACSPNSFFDFGNNTRHFCIHELFSTQRLSPFRPVIVGGGGLMYWPQKLDRVTAEAKTSVVGWGLGLNNHFAGVSDRYPDFFRTWNLLGVRDFDVGYRYLPCVSCMHSCFDTSESPEHDVIVFEHSEHPLMIPGVPSKTNDCTVEEAVEYLRTGNTVVTNTYHGAFWGQLLERHVVAVPLEDSSRFFFFKHPVAYASRSDALQVARSAMAHSGVLEEARELNRQFAIEVSEMIECPVLERPRVLSAAYPGISC